MATATSSSLTATVVEAKSSALRQPAPSSPQCVSLPTLPPLHVQSQSRVSKTTDFCRKLARNVVARTTGLQEAPAAATGAPAELAQIEAPEILKTIQDAWDKVEDKYAVTSLAVAGTVALVASSGMLSAIDQLPVVPGVLELVGIGYTGWFTYKNLIFKPDRQAFFQKIKNTYKEIIG